MLIIGLTGGIATGKSLVSGMFREMGAFIIDADILSREVVEPGEAAYFEILDSFGKDIVSSNGKIDRKKLGEIVFSDKKKRKRLEEIIHPQVILKQEKQLASLSKKNPDCLALIDAALLIEAGFHKKVDSLIVVCAKRPTQITRLFNRDGMDRNQAEKRIATQLPLESKTKIADYVIDNDGDLEDTRRQVLTIMSELKALRRTFQPQNHTENH